MNHLASVIPVQRLNGNAGANRPRRSRRTYACDSCSIKKIKCDRATPQCDWCYHHNIPCTFTRNRDSSRSSLRQPRSENSSSPSPHANRSMRHGRKILPELPVPEYGPQAVAPQGFGADICLAGQTLGNICGFNGLPFFSPSGLEWIRARTGEDGSLDRYCTMRPITWPRLAEKRAGEGDRRLSLPDKSLLLEQMEAFEKSVCGQILPLVNRACFEYTIRAAYEKELSAISPGLSSARVCIFAFMALSSFFAGQPHVDKIVTADEYAREAQDLLPEMLKESVTLDGLQALAMLCLCCQATSGDMLSVELMLSTATRFVFHLQGNVYPEDIESDPLRVKMHVRNLFWFCFIHDKIFSLRTGLQPIVDIMNCDLTLPQMQSMNGQLESLQPFYPQLNHTMFLTLIRLSLVQSKIYHGLYSFSAQRQSDADLLATIRSLDIALDEWRSSVPAFSGLSIHQENRLAEFLFEMQYHYCMAAIHQTSSRCTAWVRNQDTRAAGSSLALSVAASRSALRKFLETDPQREGQFLLLGLPELSTSAIHLFSNILMSPLEDRSDTDLSLMREVLEHIGKHIWRQTPTTFIAQVSLVEEFMGDLYHLAEMAILKARRENEH
ncbi:C6 zinc finger domain protein [Aspergillus udagawae]|uniref:C6 zinc finger domain protein n=1 Tax=Aspergillus udagawae TaxID=91492 RepID=A0ABQ1AGD6_9EURO|nr:C6 zinc finger domain protein [Aspergillus udagawae]GFG02249.1 C6 zinc finger domain protein [Aspergillus udagawae]GFG20539.1 C6 zinc finger domain protein [Aspergillus udagawae]